MQLIKHRHVHNSSKKNIKSLLRQLGIEPKTKRNSLWHLPRHELEMIFEDAKKIYQNRRILIAPRKHDDDWNAAADLNQLWQAIAKRFKDHLNPVLIPFSFAQSYTPKRPDQKVCEFSRCNKEFKPIANNQHYCSIDCRKAVQQITRSAKTGALFRFYQKVCANPDCEKEFTTKNAKRLYCNQECRVKCKESRRQRVWYPVSYYPEEKRLRLRAKWARQHRKARSENIEKVRQKTRERARQYLKTLRLTNPEKLKEMYRKQYELSKKRRNDLRINNPEKHKELCEARRVRDKARFENFTISERRAHRAKMNEKGRRWREKHKFEAGALLTI